jgi:hypothetical protein
MHEHQTHIAAYGVEFREHNVLDLLDNVLPVHVIRSLSARETAQQVGLVFGSAQNIAMVQFARHATTMLRELNARCHQTTSHHLPACRAAPAVLAQPSDRV